MHFLLSALGSAGDVYPFIAIGRALRARGHEVGLLASPWFGERIEAAGLDFIPVGQVADYERIVASPDLWRPTRAFALLVRELLAGLPSACEAARPHVRADTVLVGSTLAWHLRLLQEQLGNPAATVHLSPMCIFSGDAPARLPGFFRLDALPPRGARALLRVLETVVLDPLVAPGLNRIRATMGLPPVRRVMSRWLHAPDRVIAAWPDWLAPPQPDWPPQVRTSGFPMLERPLDAAWEPAMARLEAFLAEGPAPVGITPGSAMAHGRVFLARALDACRALGRRALVITPYADQLPGTLPSGCLHLDYLPFERVVPRLAALVHHGGIGTSAQALAAGVPQLVCAFAHDQFDNAAHLERQGVGRRVALHAPQRRWTRALDALGSSPAVAAACRSTAARMRASPDASAQIAQQLEALGPASRH